MTFGQFDPTPDSSWSSYLCRFLSSQMNVLVGNGDGSFQPPTTYSLGAATASCLTTDVFSLML